MVHYDIRETNESLTIVHALSVCFHKLCLRKWFEFNGFQSILTVENRLTIENRSQNTIFFAVE